MRPALLRLSVSALLCGSVTAVSAATVSIALTDVRVPQGELRVALVDADGYAGTARPVAAQILDAKAKRLTLEFPDIAPGSYAVMVVHDENGNGKLDSNLIGMPTEGYGFSNNPRVMRKPTFEEARFDVGDADLSLDISIR